MRYGKIENEKLIYSPNPIVKDGERIYNPSAEMLKELGYKPIIQEEYPQDEKQYKQGYKETETEIYITWIDNEVEYWANIPYDEAVNEEIRKKYSVSAEFAILRQKDEKPEEYNQYYSYCEECKAYVKSMKQ